LPHDSESLLELCGIGNRAARSPTSRPKPTSPSSRAIPEASSGHCIPCAANRRISNVVEKLAGGADIAFCVGDPWAQQNPWTIGCHFAKGRTHRKQCMLHPRLPTALSRSPKKHRAFALDSQRNLSRCQANPATILLVNLGDEMQKAVQILQEERVEPTLRYRYVSREWPNSPFYFNAVPPTEKWTPAMAGQYALEAERKLRPRRVCEDPRLYAFESTNFNLLSTVFSQLVESDRAAFVSRLLIAVRKPIPATPSKGGPRFPYFDGKTSPLALVAEFCIRTDHLKDLLAATAEPQMPTASLAIMLKEMEEMIALNFDLFSDGELATIPSGLGQLREIAERQTWSSRRPRGRLPKPTEVNPQYVGGYAEVGREIVAAIDGITEECRKARYWYLKGVLQQVPNLEIESDKLKVEGFLVKLGFTPDMVNALNAAESDYRSTASSFELKNCLSHLRSFLEHLHRQSAKSIASAAGDTVRDRWGDATLYLRQQEYFSTQHETFVTSLYTLLRDESVHPLTADREYARLLRNVVIEYGVMFLTTLDKHGVRV